MTTNPEPQAQADASLGEIKRQIIYKGQGHHCEVQLAHQFYPSSKTYSNCSNVNAKLKREPRWQCPSCGMNHDRNINAAVNLRELLTLPPGSGVKLRDGKALTVGTPHGETSPDQRACQRHTTVHQTGQKTGQSSFQQAVSYSEIPLKTSPAGDLFQLFNRPLDSGFGLFLNLGLGQFAEDEVWDVLVGKEPTP